MALGISLANAWGIFLIIFLLGYGLVEVPRYVTSLTSHQERIDYIQWKVKCNNDALSRLQDDLMSYISRLDKFEPFLEGESNNEDFWLDEKALDAKMSKYSNHMDYEDLIEIKYNIQITKNEIFRLRREMQYLFSDWDELSALSSLSNSLESSNSKNSDLINHIGNFT